jgi:hypothetical protein
VRILHLVTGLHFGYPHQPSCQQVRRATYWKAHGSTDLDTRQAGEDRRVGTGESLSTPRDEEFMNQ